VRVVTVAGGKQKGPLPLRVRQHRQPMRVHQPQPRKRKVAVGQQRIVCHTASAVRVVRRVSCLVFVCSVTGSE
jgi:hypothetical protein